MIFTYLVTVEVERAEGKFASREDIGGQIQGELESVNPDTIYGENDGLYEVTSWDVEEQPQPKRRSRK